MDSYFAIMGQILTGLLLLLLIWRRVYRHFPLYCLYLFESLASGIIMLSLYKSVSTSIYLKYYTLDFVLSSLLQFTVLVEIIHSVLKPFIKAFPRLGWLISLGFLLVFSGLLWPFVQFGIQHNLTLEAKLYFHLQILISIIRVFIFLMMAGGSRLLAIGWRDHELHIATGFGFYSLIYLTVTEIHIHQPIDWNNLQIIRGYHLFDQILVFSYLASLGYWLLMFSLKDAPRKEFTGSMADIVLRLSNKSSQVDPEVTNSHKLGAE